MAARLFHKYHVKSSKYPRKFSKRFLNIIEFSKYLENPSKYVLLLVKKLTNFESLRPKFSLIEVEKVC